MLQALRNNVECVKLLKIAFNRRAVILVPQQKSMKEVAEISKDWVAAHTIRRVGRHKYRSLHGKSVLIDRNSKVLNLFDGDK